MLVYELCVYFIMDLNLTAGKFFTFFIVLIFVSLTMNGVFRVFGAISPSFFVATQLSGIFFIAYISYLGYVIPYASMHPWFKW